MSERFVNIKNASKLLGVTPLTLRNWDKSGKFKALRHPINNYRVYKMEDVLALIDEMKTFSLARKNRAKKISIRHEE